MWKWARRLIDTARIVMMPREGGGLLTCLRSLEYLHRVVSCSTYSTDRHCHVTSRHVTLLVGSWTSPLDLVLSFVSGTGSRSLKAQPLFYSDTHVFAQDTWSRSRGDDYHQSARGYACYYLHFNEIMVFTSLAAHTIPPTLGSRHVLAPRPDVERKLIMPRKYTTVPTAGKTDR